MFVPSTQGAGAPTDPPANDGSLPDYHYDDVRIILFGTLNSVQSTIATLFKLNYADPNDWSRPLPTGRLNEVMAILTRRVRVD